MAVEAATTINQLDATKPGINDLKSEGDDHIRLVKAAIKATLPNIAGVVTPTHTQLNFVTGVTSAVQTQLDAEAVARIAGDTTANIARVTGDADLEIRKADTNGETYTGTHNFTSAVINVPTLAFGASGGSAASVDYVNNATLTTVLPGQTGNEGKVLTSNGLSATWQPISQLPVLALGII